MAIFSLPPLPSLSHTLTLSLFLSLLPGNHARKCDPACLRLAEGTVDPCQSQSEKRGRHACLAHRRYKLTNITQLDCNKLFWSINLAHALQGQYPLPIVPIACHFNRPNHACVYVRVCGHNCLACSVQCLHVYTRTCL